MPPEAPLANSTEARTETGELKSVASQSTESTTSTETTTPGTQSTTQASTDGDKSLLNDGSAKTEEPVGAPEKYTDFKVPDGFELKPDVVEEASKLFKGLNLSQDQAQSLIDFYTAKNTEAANAPYELYANMRKDWQDKVKADPEIGGRLDHVKETVSRALDSLGDAKLASEFREAMDLTGAGDHPAFIRAFYRMAQKLVEPRHVAGAGPSAAGQRSPGASRPNLASAMFPNLPT